MIKREPIKALEIKTLFILVIWVFANKPILSGFFLFFLIINLHFLVTAIIPQIFNPTAELVNQLMKQMWKLKHNH